MVRAQSVFVSRLCVNETLLASRFHLLVSKLVVRAGCYLLYHNHCQYTHLLRIICVKVFISLFASSGHTREESSVSGNIERYSRVTSKSVSKSFGFNRVFSAVQTCKYTHRDYKPVVHLSYYHVTQRPFKASVNPVFVSFTRLRSLKSFQKTNRQLVKKSRTTTF